MLAGLSGKGALPALVSCGLRYGLAACHCPAQSVLFPEKREQWCVPDVVFVDVRFPREEVLPFVTTLSISLINNQFDAL